MFFNYQLDGGQSSSGQKLAAKLGSWTSGFKNLLYGSITNRKYSIHASGEECVLKIDNDFLIS